MPMIKEYERHEVGIDPDFLISLLQEKLNIPEDISASIEIHDGTIILITRKFLREYFEEPQK